MLIVVESKCGVKEGGHITSMVMSFLERDVSRRIQHLASLGIAEEQRRATLVKFRCNSVRAESEIRGEKRNYRDAKLQISAVDEAIAAARSRHSWVKRQRTSLSVAASLARTNNQNLVEEIEKAEIAISERKQEEGITRGVKGVCDERTAKLEQEFLEKFGNQEMA